MLIEQLTYRQQDNELATSAKEVIRHVILSFKQFYKIFWNRDPETIVATLNEDVDLYLARFNENTAIGNFHNQRAEILGIAERIPVTMPDGYSFNGETFTYTEPQPLEDESNA